MEEIRHFITGTQGQALFITAENGMGLPAETICPLVVGAIDDICGEAFLCGHAPEIVASFIKSFKAFRSGPVAQKRTGFRLYFDLEQASEAVSEKRHEVTGQQYSKQRCLAIASRIETLARELGGVLDDEARRRLMAASASLAALNARRTKLSPRSMLGLEMRLASAEEIVTQGNLTTLSAGADKADSAGLAAIRVIIDDILAALNLSHIF